MNNLAPSLTLESGARLSHVFDKVAELATKLEGIGEHGEDDISVKSLIMSYKDICRSLSNVESKRWVLMAQASGITVYGAVALSWCKGAKIEDVWAGWLKSGFPLKPLPEFERPARFINPALLPQTNKSGEINSLMKEASPNGETYQLSVSATIAALKEPLEFELETDQYKGAMPQIAAFLKSRMLEKPNRTGEDEALLKVWSETVKDTEYDIWEGS